MIGSGGGFTVADFAGFGFLIGFPYRELPVVPRMQGQVSGGRFPESGLTVAVSRVVLLGFGVSSFSKAAGFRGGRCSRKEVFTVADFSGFEEGFRWG